MIKYLLFCLAGGYIGHKFKFSEAKVSFLQKLQTVAVLLILFFMGINLGSNEKLLSNLDMLGFRSLIFAISGIIFSIVPVIIFWKIIHER